MKIVAFMGKNSRFFCEKFTDIMFFLSGGGFLRKIGRRYGAPAKQSQKAGFMHGFCDDRKGRAEHRWTENFCPIKTKKTLQPPLFYRIKKP